MNVTNKNGIIECEYVALRRGKKPRDRHWLITDAMNNLRKSISVSVMTATGCTNQGGVFSLSFLLLISLITMSHNSFIHLHVRICA